jgi:hypothetical protein
VSRAMPIVVIPAPQLVQGGNAQLHLHFHVHC